MPNETSNAEKLLGFQRDYEKSVAKVDPKDIDTLNRMAANFEKITGNFSSDDLFDAAQLREAQRKEAEGKSMGGMMQYNMGGSMLVPPEREGYAKGSRTKVDTDDVKIAGIPSPRAAIAAIVAGGAKAVDVISSKVGSNLKDVIKKDGTPSKGVMRNKDGDITHLMGPSAVKTKGRGDMIKGGSIGLGTGLGASLLDGGDDSDGETPTYQLEDLPTEGSMIVESNKGETTYKNPKLKKELKKAIKNNETEVMYDDEVFNTESLEQAFKDFDGKTKKMSGGKMKYAEGSMLMPPEMEADQEMPEDTYDNIPEDEKAEAEASQLPDEEMEDGYLEYVLKESLDEGDQEYLMSVLEGDERLSGIFDKVMDVAGEFSGEGEVDGPGTGVSDSIPARLSDGEFVITEKATDQIGADNLQTMMDDAEMAYDGGYMKKAFGGLTLDPMQDEKQMYGMDQMKSTQDELRKQMLGANRMPSVIQ